MVCPLTLPLLSSSSFIPHLPRHLLSHHHPPFSSITNTIQAQNTSMVVYGGNTFDLVCSFPTDFLPYNVSDSEYSHLWGSSYVGVMYESDNDSYSFECLDDDVCTSLPLSSSALPSAHLSAFPRYLPSPLSPSPFPY